MHHIEARIRVERRRLVKGLQDLVNTTKGKSWTVSNQEDYDSKLADIEELDKKLLAIADVNDQLFSTW